METGLAKVRLHHWLPELVPSDRSPSSTGSEEWVHQGRMRPVGYLPWLKSVLCVPSSAVVRRKEEHLALNSLTSNWSLLLNTCVRIV